MKSKIIRSWNYLKTLLLHKHYVGIACWKLGFYWLAIIHDLSKFSSSEFKAYANKFGDNGKNDGRDKSGYYDPTTDTEFARAWNHHIHCNKHHWQYWITPKDRINGEECLKMLDMPNKYILEMLCDWHGASRAYKGKGMMYFWENNKDKLRLSDNTRGKIEDILPNFITRLEK